MVRGNFDDCLRISRGLAERLPGRAGELRQPGAARGPEDRGVRDRRLPRRRPRRARAARSATPATSRRTGRATASTPRRAAPPAPADAGLAGRRAPRRWCSGSPVAAPETVATAIRIGNPASWQLAVAARDESGGASRPSPTSRSSPRSASSPPRDGVFVEPASAAGVAGLLQAERRRRGRRRQADGRDGHRPRAQGHRHRAVHVHRPRRHRRGGRRGRRRRPRPGCARRSMTTFLHGPGHGVTCRPPAPTSVPASTRSASRSTTRDRLARRGRRRRRACEIEVRGRGRGRRPARRAAPGRTARCGPPSTRMGAPPPGLRLTCANVDPARPRARLVVRGDRRRASALARGLVAGGSLLMDDDAVLALAAELEGHPDNVAPALLRRLHDRLAATPTGSGPCRSPSTRGSQRGRVRAAGRPVETTVARGLLPDDVPHADAAANAGRAALLVAALTGSPSCCSPRPRTGCTRTTASRRCRRPSTLVARCGPTGCPRWSPARARRCWCSPTAGAAGASAAGAPSGWRALVLPLDRSGARVDLPE